MHKQSVGNVSVETYLYLQVMLEFLSKSRKCIMPHFIDVVI